MRREIKVLIIENDELGVVYPDREEVVAEVQRMVAGGVREITLLGQSIDGYGRDQTPPSSLYQLLNDVHEVKDLLRLRFITAHPRNNRR